MTFEIGVRRKTAMESQTPEIEAEPRATCSQLQLTINVCARYRRINVAQMFSATRL